MKPVILTLLLAGASSSALAHMGMDEAQPKTWLDASASITWRSDGAVDKDAAWRIPGIMGGGEAWPVEQGLAVDEAYLHLFHTLHENWYGVLKAGTHGGNSDDHGGLELEHAYIGWRNSPGHSRLFIEFGKLMAGFSPEIARHDADRQFSESPLVTDAFLGGHFHDEGARLLWKHDSGFSSGAEVWHGSAYPATGGEGGGNADVFARYEWSNTQWFLQTGIWLMSADADLRSDHRYADSHQHNTAFTATIPDVRFTGDSDLFGLHGHIRWNMTSDAALSLQGEWIGMQVQGEIFDGNRLANIDSDYQGNWLQAGFHWQQHSLLVRTEELSLDNRLTGAGAPQLGIDANLINQGKNPSRLSVGWHWQWQPSLAFRLEAVEDDSLPENRSRVAFGVVWRDRIWSK